MLDTYGFLLAMTAKLERWASESSKGGWSTHQVAENLRAADDCRREAARVLKLSEGWK